MASAIESLTQAPSITLKMVGVGSHFGGDSQYIQSAQKVLGRVSNTAPSLINTINPQEVSQTLKNKSVQRFGLLIHKIL
jgi:hypothetical protein